MPLYKRGEMYYADYTDASGKRIRESLGTKDKRQAQELYDNLKVNVWQVMRLGVLPDITFQQLCLKFLEDKKHKKSLDDDKGRMKYWLKSFKGVLIKEIDGKIIQHLIKEVKHHKTGKKVSESTKQRYLALLKTMLKIAEVEGWIDRAPYIKMPSVDNCRIRWLSVVEAKRLIDNCPEPLKSLVEFALCTGLRRSNIVNLAWSQIDMQNKVIYIQSESTKNGQNLSVPINDTACKILNRQIGGHHEWVFVHKKSAVRPDGTRTEAIRKMRVDDNRSFRTACKIAGISDFRFHDLRHTWASWLKQAGVSDYILREMGGWKNMAMVQRYAHLAPHHLTVHALKIDSILADVVTNSAQQPKEELLSSM